ncbi:hypothetical protein Emed_006774 [Eimeria media]
MRLRPDEDEGDNERHASAPRTPSEISNQENVNCRAGMQSADGERTQKALGTAEADETQLEGASGRPLFPCSSKLQNGISRMVSLQHMLDKLAHSAVAPASSSADAPDDAEKGGKGGTFVSQGLTLIRLPFSPQQIPLCTQSPRPRAKAGPSLHIVLASFLQLTFSCCSSTLKTRLSLDDQVLNAYICAHLLQELAARIQQVTGLTVDPYEKKHAQEGSLPALQPVETSGAGRKLYENTATDSVFQVPRSQTRSSCAQSLLLDACGLLKRTPEVAHLFNRYAILLANDAVQAHSLKKTIELGCPEESRCTNKRSSLPIQLSTAPLFSCSPGAPSYFWQKATRLGGERGFRIFVHLLHVDLAELHLFKEEDRLAHRLLEVYEVYAYMAQTANGEQLTTKLHSCLKSSEQMRNICGLSQLLQPLLHIAESTVSVFCQEDTTQLQQGFLQQYLEHLPQLALQLQNLSDFFVRLKIENIQLWKMWLHHLQQRRALRHQRDHEAHQFAAAGRAVESLWQSLEQQRKNQEFDGTGLQMQVLLLGRDQPSERQQLLEEVVSELEEVLTYAVDTRCPESLPGFDLSTAAAAVLKKLSDQTRRKPGQPLRLLLLSSKANASTSLDSLDSLSKKQVARLGGVAAETERPLLPVQEQLRRFLCQHLSAVVTCQVNERSMGRQEHVTLHFPSFSTSQAQGILSPVKLGILSPEVQQTEMQQRETVVASFEAALSVPLSRLSVHLGLTHPGFPLAFSLDLPFSFTRVAGEDTQEELVAAACASKAGIQLLSFGSMEGSPVKYSCGNLQRLTDSTADMGQGEPFVLHLPSFLSPEATSARVRELQDYPLLNTPQWNRGSTGETSNQDLRQLPAPLVGAESHKHALITVAAAAVGAASSPPSAESATTGAALAGAAAAVCPPEAAADKPSGLLRFDSRERRLPLLPTPAPSEPEDNLNGSQEPTGHLLTAERAELTAETLVRQGESHDVAAADTAPAGATPSHKASEDLEKAAPGVFKAAHRSCRQVCGCLKLRVLVSPIPRNHEAVGGFSCAGTEWLALRRAVVERKACEPFEEVCTRRRLPGSQEALSLNSSPSPPLLHEGDVGVRVDQHPGPSLCALVALSHTSLQLYSHCQTVACPRLRLRQQQVYVELVSDSLPATDWEAVLLTVLSKQLAKVDEATRAGYLTAAARAVVFRESFYEQKLRQYLLSNEATASSAERLLTCLTRGTATLECNVDRGTEADGFAGAAESATPSAVDTQGGFPVRGEQAMQLLTQKPVVHYAAIVREIRGLYNVPRRRLPASPAEWHCRYRLGRQPGHRPPGFENFAVYEAALPAPTGAPEIFTPSLPTVDILQLSCPVVALRVCLPDLEVDVFTATMPTEGENPAINQALSLKLPQLEHIESERLYRQRGFISVMVFDQLHPRLLSDTHSHCNRLPRQQIDAAAPFVFLGSFEVEWRSVLSSAEATASRIVGPAAAAEAFCQGSRPSQHPAGHEYQQKVLTRLLGVEPDGACCLCILNGCFRLRQPKGLLSHSRVTQFNFSEAPGMPASPEAPLDMFVSLKLEIRGPAIALFGGRPRHIFPEDQYQQHQQRQRLDNPSRQIKSFELDETSMLINHDVRWRQKASRCGVWMPPTIIGMDTFGCFRLLCRLLLPALPPVAVTAPFDPHCFEKTAAFVSLLPVVDEQQLFRGTPPSQGTPSLADTAAGLGSRMLSASSPRAAATGCSSFVAQGELPPTFLTAIAGVLRLSIRQPAGTLRHVIGQGERHFVLRLAPSGAAQLWDPLSGEALCLTADEQRQGQVLQRHLRHTSLEEEEVLQKERLDVLASLQRIDAERQRVGHRVAVLFPVAQRVAESQHGNLHLASTTDVREEEETAAANELQVLEQCLMELQAREDALLHEWRSLHAAAGGHLPFLLGGPQQKSQNGLWPISRLSLLFNQQNAYMNLQPMTCCNCRNSSAEASATLLVAEDSPAEFVPLTASAGIPENERHLRQTIRSRLQKRRRWRCFGVPALTHTLRAVVRVAKTPRWWLQCYLKLIAFLCCDRRLKPQAKVLTLTSCRFALQNTKDWAPFLAEPRSIQNRLVNHYSDYALGCEVEVAVGKGRESRRQHLIFTGEPQAEVYELLRYYEQARCTHAWDRPARLSLVALGVHGAFTEITGVGEVLRDAACCQTTEQALDDALSRLVSNYFPGRPLRGMVLHFVELDADKLAERLVQTRVFDNAKPRLLAFGSTERRSAGIQSVLSHTESASPVGPCLGCLVVRIFPYSCGLCSGWIFAGTVD